MSNKNKNKSKPNTDTKPAAVAPVAQTDDTSSADKPKRKRNSDPNKIKLPWAERQMKRVKRALKTLGQLAPSLKKHGEKAGVSSTLAEDAIACLTEIQTSLTGEAAKQYKPPVRANKIAIGSFIVVKSDEETLKEPVFTRINKVTGKPYLNPEDFSGGEIVGDDRMSWMVLCPDGAPRLISKKLVERAPAVDAAAAA